jgi:hypothetical protein
MEQDLAIHLYIVNFEIKLFVLATNIYLFFCKGLLNC